MRLRKKKLKVDDIGAMDETPHDEIYFKEEAKRNLQDLAKELTERTKKETELIRQHLGIDDKGCCLRHPNQFITSPPLPYRRFETIKVCLICDSEIQAGGARQRKSMKNVILDLDQLIGDRAEWRKKTNVLYNGQEIPEEEDSEEEEDPNVFKKWVPPSDEKDNKEFGHNINFFNREVEEEQAKARKNKNKKKTKKQQQEESKGKEEEEEASVLSEIIQKEDEKWKEEVKQRVAHVRAWDGDMALKQNPVYAKYWRMVNVGIPMQAIQNAMEMDGLDVRILSLDPNRPLQDQVDDIPDMEEEEREKLRRNDQLALLRDDDIYEPLTIDETVAMIYRAYERRAYFMQELDDERNPEKQKLSNKFLKKLGKGVRAPPPPLIEPKRRELPPQPEEEEEEEEEEKEEEKEEEPAAKASSSAIKDEKTSRISFSANQQVVSTDDIDSSLKGEKPLVVGTPSSLSTITTLQPPPPPALKTPSTLGGPGSPSLKGSPTSMQSAPQPIAFFPEPDDTMPAFPVDDGGTKQRVKKKKPFQTVTKLGSTKYEVARSKQELHQATKELAQRTVIIGSLQSQLEYLQKEFAQREREVERMKHELYELDPNDPLCNRTPQEQEQERNLVIDGPFRDIDRTDVVRARMAKLSILPVPLR